MARMRYRPGACAANGAAGADAHSRAQLKAPTRGREIMAERSSSTGSAAVRADAGRSDHDLLNERTGWPKNPRALAGRLRRHQDR